MGDEDIARIDLQQYVENLELIDRALGIAVEIDKKIRPKPSLLKKGSWHIKNFLWEIGLY